ncbi:MAG: T9SS type A sorting domain-containing protein [candidate division KSB1 bacterium]|nr:T9SS type A sorting domain-containing protein [candidate division KSB1 bacterium]MDZ7305090.1 T9SS type A sorting domain-containing protein [candidate division KSB1 bacterium]MDZ7313407.1 T9SS type A sorting domain-containing protein [candidate division KSB1 bacterium]
MTRLAKLSVFLIVLFCMEALLAQYPNIRVSRPESTWPEEVTIAIDPTNPLNLAAGANIDFYYFSTDGGSTWNEGRLSSSLGVAGDPCVAFDAAGNLYYAHLSRPASGSWLDRIVVQKSTNGGVSWNDGTGAGLNPPKHQDKEWLIADHTNSPFRNHLYMAWTEFDKYGSTNPKDSTRILFSHSTDSGATWSLPVRISDRGGDCIDSDNTVEGAVPAVGPNGEIYLSWAGPLGLMFDKSTDGGKTFGKDLFITSQPGGWDFKIPGIYRCNGMPVTVCDISNSPYRGNIYVLWSDQRNGTDNTDIFLIKSKDGGKTWGPIKKVNDDATKRHQFFPWITVDPVTGILYVAFYDRRNTQGDETEVYVARSRDGGESFENFKVSASPFTPRASIFFGDYINIAARNGKVYPIWMRMEATNLSVWVAIIMDTVTSIIEKTERPVDDFQLLQSYPNPLMAGTTLSAAENPITTIHYYLPLGQIVSLKIHDLMGREVATLIDQWQAAGEYKVHFDGRALPNGVYLYRLVAGKFSATKKFLLLR